MKRRVSIIFLAVLFFTPGVSGSVSQAATVTTNTLVDPSVYDFSSQPMFNYPVGPQNRSIGPVNMTWNASGPYDGLLDYQVFINLGLNSAWFGSQYGNLNGVSNGYAATTGKFKWISFTFDQAVSAVGGLVNYSVFNGRTSQAVMKIYDADDVLLEAFDLPALAPISTGSSNSGEFRGFVRNKAEIVRFELYGAMVIDDLTISTYNMSAVPLPAGFLFLFSGLAGLFIMRNKAASPSRGA